MLDGALKCTLQTYLGRRHPPPPHPAMQINGSWFAVACSLASSESTKNPCRGAEPRGRRRCHAFVATGYRNKAFHDSPLLIALNPQQQQRFNISYSFSA